MVAWQTNAANEITDIDGTNGEVTPAYDDCGNMISGPRGDNAAVRLHYKYDAWNRLVVVYADSSGQPGTTIATYAYDGQGRRISKAAGGDTLHYYYDENYRNIETRKNSDADPLEQFVWDARYVDSMICRFYDGNLDGDVTGGSSEGDSILYVLNDVNFNVTAIVDADPNSASEGDVVERYSYTAYGPVAWF